MPRNFYKNPAYNVAKRVFFETLFRSGLIHLFRRKSRGSVLVLIYHDVIPSGFPEANPLFGMTVSAAAFAWKMKYLKRHYNLITFRQLAYWFYGGTRLPPCPAL